MAEANVGVKLSVEGTPQVEEAFRKVASGAEGFDKKANTLSSTLKKLGSALIGIFAVQKIIAFFKSATDEALEQTKVLTLVSAAISKVGLDYDTARPKIDEFAKTMLDLGRADTETYSAISRLLPRTKNLDEAIRLTKLASDLASSGILDYSTNVDLLAKVIIGRGQRALIQFGVGQMTNVTIAEQLAAIQSRVTMTTEQWAETTEGSISRARVQWKNMKQDLGAFGAITLVNLSNAFVKNYNKIGGGTVTLVQRITEWFNVDLPNVFDYFGIKLLELSVKWEEFSLKMNKYMPLPGVEEGLKKEIELNKETVKILEEGMGKRITDFKTAWDDLQGISSEGTKGLIDDLDNYDEEASKTAEKAKSAFEGLAKTIVSNITKQIDKIQELRDSLKGLADETEEQLKKSEEAYQENLKTTARQAQEKIDQIDKEIEDTQKEMGKGWRDRIVELEKEKEKEKSIIDRIGGEISNIQLEAKKDDLTILQEAHQKEIKEIKEQGKIKELEIQKQILETEIVKTKGAIEILKPGALGKMAEAEAKLKPWEISPYQNIYNFNFEGEGWDKDTIVQMIINALNRESALRYGGK